MLSPSMWIRLWLRTPAGASSDRLLLSAHEKEKAAFKRGLLIFCKNNIAKIT